MASEPSGVGLSESGSPPPPSAPPESPPESPVNRLFAELMAKAHEARPRDDLAQLEKAFRFASEHHKLQIRDSGDPYMVHPLLVAHLLADMKMDLVSMETGLLHDVVEDTSVGALRGRRHQAEQAGFLLGRRAAGRELPQDAAGDGERYPGHHREAGGPAAQHAHARFRPRAGAARAHRARNHRDLRPDSAPPGYGQDARRTGGSGVPLH